MSDTQSLFFSDVAMSQFDDLIKREQNPAEKERLEKQKQAILARMKEEDRQDLEDLPSKKKKV